MKAFDAIRQFANNTPIDLAELAYERRTFRHNVRERRERLDKHIRLDVPDSIIKNDLDSLHKAQSNITFPIEMECVADAIEYIMRRTGSRMSTIPDLIPIVLGIKDAELACMTIIDPHKLQEETAKALMEEMEAQIAENFLRRIPDEKLYRIANRVLREFKKSMGLPDDEDGTTPPSAESPPQN